MSFVQPQIKGSIAVGSSVGAAASVTPLPVGADGTVLTADSTTPTGLKYAAGSGFQGSQGFQGPQGNQGNQGVEGTQGNQGSQGPQGFQGVAGSQGFQGFQGTGPGTIVGFGGIPAGGTNDYLTRWGAIETSTTISGAATRIYMTRAGTLRNLRGFDDGGAVGNVFTVQVNGVNTAIVGSTTGAGAFSDLTNTAVVAAGDYVEIRQTAGGNTSGPMGIELQLD